MFIFFYFAAEEEQVEKKINEEKSIVLKEPVTHTSVNEQIHLYPSESRRRDYFHFKFMTC